MADTDAAADTGAAAKERRFWNANLRLIAVLVSIWALVSYGFGVVLRGPLDAFSIGGAPLGFWFAQQGSIYAFVIMVFVYCVRMADLAARFGGEEPEDADVSD